MEMMEGLMTWRRFGWVWLCGGITGASEEGPMKAKFPVKTSKVNDIGV